MLYCMRCAQPLLVEVRSGGLQVILLFEGNVTKALAVYHKQQSQQVESIEIDGPIVRITLPDNLSIERTTVSLFEVLRQGAELWTLE